MIVKTGPDLNSAISAGAEIHLFRVFPRCGKKQSKGQPVTGADMLRIHWMGKKRRYPEGKKERHADESRQGEEEHAKARSNAGLFIHVY